MAIDRDDREERLARVEQVIREHQSKRHAAHGDGPSEETRNDRMPPAKRRRVSSERSPKRQRR